MTRLVHLSQTEFEQKTSLLTADQADYQSFLAEYGITEEDVRAVTYSGEIHHLPMDGIEIRESAIQGYGLFASRLFREGEIIAPAALNGYKTAAGRYTNHSPNPNAKMVVRDADNIDLVAVREINGEEITTDYRETLRSRAKTTERADILQLEIALRASTRSIARTEQVMAQVVSHQLKMARNGR